MRNLKRIAKPGSLDTSLEQQADRADACLSLPVDYGLPVMGATLSTGDGRQTWC